MNIISNNCLGGFLYRDVLKSEYKSPFIWTLMDPDLYIDFIDNFEQINFDNFELINDSKELSNKFAILIDEKYKLKYIHAHFDKNVINKPKIINADVYYSKIWEYIVDVYTRRVERMKQEKEKLFLFHEPNLHYTTLNKLPEICERHKYNCLIFANDNIIENDYCKKFSINKKWPTHQPLIEKYKNVFNRYLCK